MEVHPIEVLLDTYKGVKTTQKKLRRLELDEALLALNASSRDTIELERLGEYLAERAKRPKMSSSSEYNYHDWTEVILLAADVMREFPSLSYSQYSSIQLPILLHAFAIYRIARAVRDGVDLQTYVRETYKAPTPESIRQRMEERAWDREDTPIPSDIFRYAPESDKRRAMSETSTKDWTEDLLNHVYVGRTLLADDIQRYQEELESQLRDMHSGTMPLEEYIANDSCLLRAVNAARTALKKLGQDTPPSEDDEEPELEPEPASEYVSDGAGTSTAGSQSRNTETKTKNTKRRRISPYPVDFDSQTLDTEPPYDADAPLDPEPNPSRLLFPPGRSTSASRPPSSSLFASDTSQPTPRPVIRPGTRPSGRSESVTCRPSGVVSSSTVPPPRTRPPGVSASNTDQGVRPPLPRPRPLGLGTRNAPPRVGPRNPY
ncbi:hypothetical protein F5Y13DRAFT_198187 [Hypoxylon sp. FL1857]|nr:hypothetical protein F5Y13DRAFT_198187 [Hypoxylon sp. FL1857]